MSDYFEKAALTWDDDPNRIKMAQTIAYAMIHQIKPKGSEIILDYAKEKEARYIVLGSHGRSGIYDVFVGSLTKDITKKSPIPVLVLPCHGK